MTAAKVVPSEEGGGSATKTDENAQDSQKKSEKKSIKGIKKLDSFSDKSGRRLRILRAQGPVIQIKDGISDSIVTLLFGKSAARFLWKMVDNTTYFYVNAIICLIGLLFTIIDITTPSLPQWMSFMCLLVVPWGIIVTLLLKVQVVRLLLTTFNVWFLITQAAAMMVCIILVCPRPLVTFVLVPPVIASVVVDAFPQEHRRKVTGFTYFVMMAFTLAFDASLLFKLLPFDEPLAFNVNDMQFSGKALAFGCSLNLSIFILRNVTVLIFYPYALTLFAANLRSSRFSNYRDPEALWQETLKKSGGSSIGGSSGSGGSAAERRPSSALQLKDARKKMVWILRPVQTPVILETRDTLASRLLGAPISALLWGIAKNPISFLITVPGVLFLEPLLETGLDLFPKWTIVFSWLVMSSLVPGLLILNVYLAKKLVTTFQVWFLLSMSFGLLGCWYTEFLDIRLVSIPIIICGMLFSIVLDAYPGSGRFLAGMRFYFFKITLASSVVGIFLLTDAPLKYFQISFGELSFAGSAICVSCATNLVVFGLRNLYVLLSEPECLVVLNCLVEYAAVPQDVAWKEIASYES